MRLYPDLGRWGRPSAIVRKVLEVLYTLDGTMPAVGPRYKKTAGHVLPRRCRRPQSGRLAPYNCLYCIPKVPTYRSRRWLDKTPRDKAKNSRTRLNSVDCRV